MVNQADGMPSRAVLIFQSVQDRTEFWHKYMGKSLVEEGICDQGKRLKMRDVMPWTKRHRTDSRSRSRHRHGHRADAGHGHNTDLFVSDKWRPWHEESHSHHRSEALRRWGGGAVSVQEI